MHRREVQKVWTIASCATWISGHPLGERLMFLGSRLVYSLSMT
jgi:hypothetical protein